MSEFSEVEEVLGGRWVNADDVDELVRRLDRALNGARAAPAAKLSDIVSQVEAVERVVGPILWSL